MHPSLSEVRQELAVIHDQLLALPPNAFSERFELKERQRDLRRLSYELLEGEPLHDQELLRAEYKRLQEVRDRLLDQHLSHHSVSVGDAGIEGAFVTAINKAIDAGIGVDEIEARLKEILGQMRNPA